MKLCVMYKIIMLQETLYIELFFFSSSRLTGNQLILMYYFMLDRQQALGWGGGIGSSCSQWCSYILLRVCVCVC